MAPLGNAGAGEALGEVLDDQGVVDPDERLFVESSLQALLGHADGRYRGGENAVAAERVPELLKLLLELPSRLDRPLRIRARHAPDLESSLDRAVIGSLQFLE